MEARDALGAAEVERERERGGDSLYCRNGSVEILGRLFYGSLDYDFTGLRFQYRRAPRRSSAQAPCSRQSAVSSRRSIFWVFNVSLCSGTKRDRAGGCSELKYGNAQIEILRGGVRERGEKGDSNLNNLTNL